MIIQKTCPNCNTVQSPISATLTDKEIKNMSKLSLSFNLCKTCYITALTNQIEPLKIDLASLNKKKDNLQILYHSAYNSWKEQADIFRMIDYNLALISHKAKNKEKKLISSLNKSDEDKPISNKANPKEIVKKLLANFSQAEQQRIMESFQAMQTSET